MWNLQFVSLKCKIAHDKMYGKEVIVCLKFSALHLTAFHPRCAHLAIVILLVAIADRMIHLMMTMTPLRIKQKAFTGASFKEGCYIIVAFFDVQEKPLYRKLTMEGYDMGELFENKNIFLTLTYQCNAFCQKCMTRYHVKQGQEMSVELIDIICSRLKSADYKGLISIGSGESILYDNLKYCIEKILSINSKISMRILTNGQNFTKDLPSIFFDRRCKWGITMDGFFQASLQNLQMGISIEQVKSNIIDIVKIYGAKNLYLNFTLHEKNYEELIDYCKFAVSLNITEVYVTELKIYEGYEQALERYKLRRTEKFYKILEEAKTILSNGNISTDGLDVDRYYQKSGCFLKNRANPIIDVDGSLTLCGGREDIYVGNMQDPDIENKWEAFSERLSSNPDLWCNYCHDRILPNGLYNLPETIKR